MLLGFVMMKAFYALTHHFGKKWLTLWWLVSGYLLYFLLRATSHPTVSSEVQTDAACKPEV